MERSLTEEDVTKGIMKWLVGNGWEIVCFDFPQSGTGRQIHPNNHTDKTSGIIVPDIIAVKDKTALYFEDKDRFYTPDFEKIRLIKTTGTHSDGLRDLLSDFDLRQMFYGIGMPYSPTNFAKSKKADSSVDFIFLFGGADCPAIIDRRGGIFA